MGTAPGALAIGCLLPAGAARPYGASVAELLLYWDSQGGASSPAMGVFVTLSVGGAGAVDWWSAYLKTELSSFGPFITR